MRTASVGQGRYRVVIEIAQADNGDICAFVYGGDRSHVGGTAIAVPRPRSNGEGMTCDVSQICVPGHKDVHAAAEVAKIIALKSERVASVTAGIHVDNAKREEIELIMSNAAKAACDLFR